MKKTHKILNYTMTALLLVSMLLLAREAADYVVSGKLREKNVRLVVIDAGHGAEDSGKIGVNGVYEKDINLAIALRVRELLEAQDVEVVLTREDDKGLYPQTGNSRKLRDMQRRVELINKEEAALTVSIHQNSYTEEKIYGAQTFYYAGSEEGKRAAKLLQTQLVKCLDTENHRQAKENDSYYLLKNVKTPIVIAECGFLSNQREARLLCEEDYQEQVAWAIHLGILQYLNSREQKGVEHTYEMEQNSNQNDN